MGADWITVLLAWAGDNSALLLLLVVGILFLESFTVLGILVPGFLLVILLGALAALGRVDPWLTWAAASLGCIVGDVVNYWLGRRFQATLRGRWPLQRFPETMQRGELFLQRYGGLSLFLGRYLGPLRSFMPIIAGSLGMRPQLALPMIAVAAMSWVALSMLSGMVLGVSLELAAAYTTRLAILLLLVAAGLWLLGWLVRAGYLLAGRYNPWLLKRMLMALRRHPRIGSRLLPLFAPLRGELLSVAMLGLLALAGFTILIILTLYLLIGDSATSLDLRLAAIMQDLRSPISDAFWVVLAVNSTTAMLTVLLLGMSLWLACHRQRLSVWHWLAAVLPVPLLGWLLHGLLQFVPIWPAHLQAALAAFPDAASATLAALFMALPMLLVRELPAQQRKWYYLAVASLLSLLLMARLALGLAYLSAILVAVLLALVWVSMVGIAFRVRAARGNPIWRHTIFFAVLFSCTSLLLLAWHYSSLREQWQLPLTGDQISLQDWQQQDWQRLPHWRSDYARAPVDRLNLQFSGALQHLQTLFLAADWEQPEGHWWELVSPAPDPASLPVYRLGYRGRSAALLLRQHDGEQQHVLRMWASGWQSVASDVDQSPALQPIWLGSLSVEQIDTRAYFLNFWRASALPEADLLAQLGNIQGLCLKQREANLVLLTVCR